MRLLDIAIGEHITGFVFVNGHDTDSGHPYTLAYPPLLAESWLKRFPDSKIAAEPHVPRSDVAVELLPKYSTDIAAAWQVRDAIGDRVFSVREKFTAALKYEIDQRCKVNVAWTAVPMLMTPEDICRAALRAVGKPAPLPEVIERSTTTKQRKPPRCRTQVGATQTDNPTSPP
jgi:hypothetical protein